MCLEARKEAKRIDFYVQFASILSLVESSILTLFLACKIKKRFIFFTYINKKYKSFVHHVVNWAVSTLEVESQPIEGFFVNHASYIGKLLKTDARVPGRLKADKHTDFYRDVLGVDKETVAFLPHG